MQVTERERQLIETMLLLKEENQRLVRRHREVMEEFDLLKEELLRIRKERQRQRGHEIDALKESGQYHY
jgi:hypothetical protein